MNLYELPAAYAAWSRAVDDAGGEMTPALEAELVSIEGSLRDRTDAACALIRAATVEAEAIRAEAARLAARARACENRAARLKELLVIGLKSTGLDSLDAGRFRIVLRKAALPTIRWTGDPEDMPDWCVRVRKEYDAGVLIDRWKASGGVPEGFNLSFSDVLTIR